MDGSGLISAGRVASAPVQRPSAIPASPAPAFGSTSRPVAPGRCSPIAFIPRVIFRAASSSFGARRVTLSTEADMEPIWAVGLMTGTVLDGNIDVALLRTDGQRIETFGAYDLVPYPQSTRDLLEQTLAAARTWNFTGPEPAIFARAEEELTRGQSAAVKTVVTTAGLSLDDIGVVGFHGQSVLHRAPTRERIGATRQLGNGTLMHELLGVPVTYDFRS